MTNPCQFNLLFHAKLSIVSKICWIVYLLKKSICEIKWKLYNWGYANTFVKGDRSGY